MPRTDGKSGFTLIEMLAVMMIIALVAALAATRWQGTGRAGLKSVVMRTAALIRHARSAAILTGRDRHIALDGPQRAITDGSDAVVLPKDVAIDILDTGGEGAADRSIVAFHPDGTSTGAALQLSRQGVAYEIHVNWLNGRVAIEAP